MQKTKELSHLTLLGVKITDADRRTIKKAISDHLSSRSPSRLDIFTPNPIFLTEAHKHPSIVKLLNSADISLADGVGITLAARLTGKGRPERFPGIECGEFILSEAERYGLSVFLLGGRIWVAHKAAVRLRERFPDLNICGTHHGYFPEDSEEKLIKKIGTARPDILIVCLGFPKQERWIAENAHHFPSLRLSIALGGSLDVWSGGIPRAPEPLRRAGLEWLWRAFREPRRMLALYKLPMFLWLAVREDLSMRTSRGKPRSTQ